MGNITPMRLQRNPKSPYMIVKQLPWRDIIRWNFQRISLYQQYRVSWFLIFSDYSLWSDIVPIVCDLMSSEQQSLCKNATPLRGIYNTSDVSWATVPGGESNPTRSRSCVCYVGVKLTPLWNSLREHFQWIRHTNRHSAPESTWC